MEDIRYLASYNREKIFAVKDTLLDICSEARTFEEILQQVFTGFGLTMTFEQYALVGSTIRSYLSWLKEEKLLSASFEENRLLWRTVDG